MAYHFSTIYDGSFDEALTAARSALQERGFGVLSEIDVSATLKNKIGVDIPPYRILGACNPRLAHRALGSEPRIGLMLPCNVVVRRTEDGETEISAVDPVASMMAVDNPALGETAHEVRSLMQEVVSALRPSTY